VLDLAYILRRAWQIPWNHRLLWLFGACVGMGAAAGRAGLGNRGVGAQVMPDPPAFLVYVMPGTFVVSRHPLVIGGIVMLAAEMALGLWWLESLGRVGLVHQAGQVEDIGVAKWKSAWLACRRWVWEVFALRLLLAVPVVIIAGLGLVPALGSALYVSRLYGQAAPASLRPLLAPLVLACISPTVCLGMLLSIPANILLRLAVRVCILEGLSWRESAARAWAILRQRPAWVILLWIIQAAITMLVVVVVGAPLVLLTIASSSVALALGLISPTLRLAVSLLSAFMIWVASVVVHGVLEAHLSTMWTVAFREMEGLGLVSGAGQATG
jgi:hypothetical protein